MTILGLNEDGHEGSNDLMCEGRDLPWLQDTPADGVWDSWTHVYRDVIVLGRDNIPVGVYNLSSQDLGDAANFAALKQLFLDAHAAP